MRRLLVALAVSAGLTGVIIVLPVFGSAGPEPVPVTTFSQELAMGSSSAPAPGAELRAATTVPVAGVPESSPVLALTRSDTRNFSLVGVTWAYDPAVTDTLVQIRVRDEQGAWGTWTEMASEDVGQPGARDGAGMPRGGTAPLWTGPSTGVQAELVTRSGAQPTDVRLDLVDPGASPADAALGPADIQDTADAAMAMPHVYSRAQWGADEGIRTWDPSYASTIKAATVHHTADSNDYTADQVPAIMRSIYRYHTVSRGWGDIGYNVIVDKFGRLWEGRYGGLASTVVGAHAGGFNTGTFGVSMLGNYDTAETPQATVDSVAAIIAWKFALYGVDPRGSTTLVSGGGGTSRYAKGTSVTLPTVFGHRDVGSTSCPGRYGYARMGEIRDKVSATLGTVVPLIQQRYQSDAGARDVLGSMTDSPTRTPDGVGAYAHYDRGSIYASNRTAAHVLRGPIRDRWAAAGWERGALGYPVGDPSCGLRDGGCFQHFQGGSIYWSPATGARVLSVEVRDRWGAAGWENGALGYPVSDVGSLKEGGRFVHFQGGSIYWSPGTGARIVSGVVRDRWAASGWENGPLGYPVGDVTRLADGGMFAHFQRGSVYWSSGTGARLMLSPVRDRWGSAGWENGALGYPVTDQVATPGGAGQVVQFQRGWIYWSADGGARVVGGAVRDAWLAAGGDAGDLGMPIADAGRTADGVAEFGRFSGGAVYLHPDLGTRVVPGPVVTAWDSAGGIGGPLGYPVADAVATSAGVVMAFQGGEVYAASGTGHALHGAVRDRYNAAGGPEGELGYPTTGVRALSDGGTFAHFQNGSIYWTQATGARIVSGPVRDRWAAAGWQTGVLGYPTGEVRELADGGTVTAFQGGSVYWSQATGARLVSGAVLDRFSAAGGPGGSLGYPTTDVTALAGGGRFAHFQGGSVYWTQ
ncbi:N-acetylmuramoyl-L-alanine amidase, partial [Blastococcus saxobsidens]|uniref:N-acetylmuramoyl-L-alanine amidase n=1 Tax=Blastococcus saxobsidens TaxID=138336 RepID=UPI0020115B4B